jgi:hypothetical protein
MRNLRVIFRLMRRAWRRWSKPSPETSLLSSIDPREFSDLLLSGLKRDLKTLADRLTIHRSGATPTFHAASCHRRRSSLEGSASPASLKMLVGAFWAEKTASAFSPSAHPRIRRAFWLPVNHPPALNRGAGRPLVPR